MRRIVERAAISHADMVLEVGAGHGNLTRLLAAEAAGVIAVEIDRRCEPHLTHLQREFPNVIVAWGDVLTLDWEPLWAGTPPEHRVLVGNIPYQITSPLLARLAGERGAFRHAVLMVQREVAERLVAPPGTRTRGALTVKAALDFETRILLRVSRQSFKPRPQVESAVIGISPLAQPPVASEEERALARRVIEAAFGSRRQQVANALATHFAPSASKAQWLERLARVGIAPTLRAESLTLEQFLALAREVDSLIR